LQRKITKVNQLIPQVVDGYCNFRKIPGDYRSKIEDRVTRNYNGRILHRCIDHGLTQDKERRFTPKPCVFDYAEKKIQRLKKKQNNIVLMAIRHFDQVTVLTQMILQLKIISADNGADNADNEAILNTGHAAEHVVKEASDNSMPSKNANVSFNLV
jgi:hypothetical protein